MDSPFYFRAYFLNLFKTQSKRSIGNLQWKLLEDHHNYNICHIIPLKLHKLCDSSKSTSIFFFIHWLIEIKKEKD